MNTLALKEPRSTGRTWTTLTETPLGPIALYVDDSGALTGIELPRQATNGTRREGPDEGPLASGGAEDSTRGSTRRSADLGAPADLPTEAPDAARVGLAEAARQLEEYLRGDRQAFDLRLAPTGTAFQRAVWEALRRIPYGRTISYGDLARSLGRPGGSRAVGAANGANPIPIVVPCHRVIASDGGLGGYSGGLQVKRRLLTLEGALLV